MASIIDRVIAQALAGEPGAVARRVATERRRKLESQIEKRGDLLAQPDLLEKRVAAHASAFSLSTRRARTRRWQSKIDALEEQARGTPQEGFASELLTEYTRALDDPNYLGVSNRQLLSAVSANLLTRPDEEGKTRLERAYRYKWRADTSLGNLFGIFGEDKDVKALPGYERYLKKQKELPVEEWHTGPGEAALYGAGFTAALMAGSKVLGKAAMVTPAPGARLVGGALLAIPEFMAFDAIHNVIAKSEWGRAREGTWRKIGADLLAGGAVIGGGYKIATSALRKAAEKAILSKSATDLLKQHPTAKRALEAGEAQRVARLAQAELDVAMEAGISKGDVLGKVDELMGTREGLLRVLRGRAEALARPGEPAVTLAALRAQPSLAEYVTRRAAIHPKKVVKEAKGLIDSILAASGAKVKFMITAADRAQLRKLGYTTEQIRKMKPEEAGRIMGVGETAKAFTKLSEESSDRALKKARTKGVRTAVAEEARIGELENDLAKREGEYLKGLEVREGELETAYIARLEARELALEERLTGLRAEQRTKVKSHKVVQKDIEATTPPGRVMTKEEVKAGLMARKKGVTRVPPEATGLTEEARIALETVEDETRQTVSIHERAGLEELLYGGGTEEGEAFVEGVKKGGKDLVDLMGDAKKLFGTIGLLGSVALASLFEPDSAEASVLGRAGVTVAKNVARTAEKVKTKEAMVKLAEQWRKAKALHIPAAEGAKEKLSFQEVIRTAPMAIEEHGSLVKNIKAQSTPWSLAKVLSPYTAGEILYKTNPIPEVGNLQSAIGNNAGDALRVVANIFRDVPDLVPKGAAKDIMQTMSPIAKKYSSEIVALRAVEFDLNKTTKSFNKLYKALSKEKGEMHVPALEKIEERMAKLTVAREELAPALSEYLAEWEAAAQKLARKYPTTRIALAAEDTAEYTKYPWLKEIITPEEEEAVIWLKNLHETYGIRMLEADQKVIEGPYVHHAWHPDWLEEAAAKRLEQFGLDSKGVPYSKFFHRAKYSRMMMPEINYTMQRYLMDAERRIQWSQFWGVGSKNGWYAHKRWVEHFGSKDHQTFWRKLTEGAIPPAPTRANVISNVYTSFEVLRLLAFSPSVALKHYFKNIGTISAMGAGNFASHLPEAMMSAVRGARNTPEMKALAKRFGVTTSRGRRKLLDEVADSFITQIHRMNMIADLDFEAVVPHRAGFWKSFTEKLQTWNRWGSIPVRAIESVDRHHTVVAAWEMAAKRGMTAQQAIYGIYSNILKLNFLSGAANPAWIRNPKIRAMLLFQNTVFKIMERRLMTAWRAGQDIKTAIGVVRHQDIPTTLKEMAAIGRYVLRAEKELKQNMIFDALTATKDVFGTPMLQQAMREAIYSGAILMGGGIVGMNLMPQVWHLPLLRHGAKAPTLAVNPFLNAIFRTAGQREKEVEYGVEHDFFVAQFLKNWMKSTGYIPQTLNKAIRITQDDVPEIYKGSKWQYFFSIPAAGEHY